jgi:serine/threonine protein kinase
MAPLESVDPSSIGGYELVKRLGTGATGIVYEGVNSEGKRAAIKVIRRELADAPQVRERLRREAQSLRRVSGERCAEVYEVDADADVPYLVMELIPGQDLSAEIAERGPLRGAMLRTVFLALVEALESIHAAGIIHRDLKPSNVLIGASGIRVVDFGISVIHDVANLTSTGVVVGTTAWMSPEQIDGRDLTKKSDVFNLGLIMAFAITGQHPFGSGRPDAVMYRIMNSDPDLTSISADYRQIIERCLSKDPGTRPSLQEIAVSLASRSGSGDESVSAGTVVLPPEYVEQVVESGDKQTVNETVSPQKSSVKAYISKKKKFTIIATSVGVVAALVAIVGIAAGGESTSSTTTTVARTTTTIAVVPAFEIYREKGVGFRWDACSGAINVGVNFGKLDTDKREKARKAVIQAISEVAETSGLPFLYAGETSSMGSSRYRDGRNGSQALLLTFHPPGVGLLSKDENYVHETFMSYGNVYGSWREIKSFDIQINSKDLYGSADFLRESRRAMLNAVGLTWVQSPHELMGEKSGYLTTLDDFGPGDVQGMIALGKSQGCIK